MWKYSYNPIAEFWKGVSLRFPSCTYSKFRNIHGHTVYWNTLHQLGYPACLANFEQAVFLSKVISMKASLNHLPVSLEVKCTFKNSPVTFSWRLSNQYSAPNINLPLFFIFLQTYFRVSSLTIRLCQWLLFQVNPALWCPFFFCHLNFKNRFNWLKIIIILSKLILQLLWNFDTKTPMICIITCPQYLLIKFKILQKKR